MCIRDSYSMGANGLQPILNAIMSIFSFIGCRCLRLSPLTCCVSCSSHTPFCSCFVQLALQAQTGTKHERQCAPHDGSLATVCGNSRGSSIVQAGNYKIKNATHSFEWHLLVKSFYLLCKWLGKSPRTALESVYPSELPPMMESFFLCYGDETPGSVEPSGEHASCF